MVSFDDFKKLDIRIAEIVEARAHPNAEKLYVLKINTGDAVKQIVAGIRRTYDAEALVGKKIVVVDNLEPAVLRGEESNGMLLAASSPDGPVLIISERDVPSGAKIS